MTQTLMRALTIVNKKGLHARASARFVSVTEAHDARATVRRDGLEVSGDSIMGLMMLAAAPGTEIEISCEGTRGDEALEALSTLVGAGFDEELCDPKPPNK